MDTRTLVLWLTLGEGAVLLWMFLSMPVMGGARAFFGVRVDERTFAGRHGRAILRRYRWTVAGVVVCVQACGYLLAARAGSPFPAVLASLATLCAGTLIYNRFWREVRPLGTVAGATRFASSLHVRSLKDHTSVWVEAVIVAATLAPFVLLGVYYAQLPDLIPVHWNARGEADGWTAKTAAAVFFIPTLAAYMQIWFVILKHDIAHAKMTLPAEHTAEYLRGKERFLRTNMLVAEASRVAVALLLLCISSLLVTSVVPELRPWRVIVNGSLWSVVAAMLAALFALIMRAMKINRELQDSVGDWYVQRPADEARWQGGGLGYSNPDDPALMVERLIGVGYTYNTAHPAFRTRLALLAGVVLFAVWAIVGV